MKKPLVLIVCLALILSLFSGCGISTSADSADSTTISSETFETSATSYPDNSEYSSSSSSYASTVIDMDFLSEDKEVVQYAQSYIYDTFALLFSDGTVAVGSDCTFTENLIILDWQNIKKIWVNDCTVIGLHEDGTVIYVNLYYDNGNPILCEDPSLNFDHLQNVVDICFMDPDPVYFFLTEDNHVICVEAEQMNDDTYYATHEWLNQSNFESFADVKNLVSSWTNVKKLIPLDIPIAGVDFSTVVVNYKTVFAINYDGTVRDIHNIIPPDKLPLWTDIVDIFSCNYKIYGIKKDGSIVIHNTDPDYYDSIYIPNEEDTLFGANMIYRFEYSDLPYGLTTDGKLVFGGGKEFLQEYFENDLLLVLSDLSEFENIKQLAMTDNQLLPPIVLKNDGTVASVDQYIHQYVSQWSNIEKIIVSTDIYRNIPIIYGLHSDGTVSALEVISRRKMAHYPDNYMEWNLLDIYSNTYCGLIGICPDGSLIMPNYSQREENFYS